jgi:hypothetical protein
MKIWLVTFNDDDGIGVEICYSEAEAEDMAREWVKASWEEYTPKPMPDDWRRALDALSMQPCFMDSVTVSERDISDHPALQRA